MVVNKRRSSSRNHGYRTHGWGHHKRHRGAGNRGGKGFSNKGKRGQSRKPTFRDERKGATKVGFIFHGMREKVVPITLAVLQQKLDALVASGVATKKGDTFEVNIAALGCNKVLGTGKVRTKLKLTAPAFTSGAVEKLKANGGSALFPDGSEVGTAEAEAPVEAEA